MEAGHPVIGMPTPSPQNTKRSARVSVLRGLRNVLCLPGVSQSQPSITDTRTSYAWAPTLLPCDKFRRYTDESACVRVAWLGSYNEAQTRKLESLYALGRDKVDLVKVRCFSASLHPAPCPLPPAPCTLGLKCRRISCMHTHCGKRLHQTV